MSNVLTTDSVIQCPHQGQLMFGSVNNKLRVEGKPVLLKSDISNALVSNCDNPTSGTSSQQCLKVSEVTQGEASKLKVGGVAVMLGTLTGDTNGFPPKPSPLKVVHVQHKLTAS
jgi:hypothetical protein